MERGTKFRKLLIVRCSIQGFATKLPEVVFWVMLLRPEEGIHRIDGRFHNQLYLVIRDVGEFWISRAGSASLTSMNILDRAISKC